MRIPFNIKYRSQIESGEYKVVTRNGYPVNIVCWNSTDHCNRGKKFPIVGLIPNDDEGTTDVEYFAEDGSFELHEQSVRDLFISINDLPDIPTELSRRISDTLSYCMDYGSEVEDKWNFIGVQINDIWGTFCEEMGKIGKFDDLVKGDKTIIDIPKWRHWYVGAAGNGSDKDVYLIKEGIDSYRLSPVIRSGDEYIVLSELNKLPKL